MPVVEKNSRELLKGMTMDDVFKAMELFDQRIRRHFDDTRWRRWWDLRYNRKHYPPKDLLRCVIAVMSNVPHRLASVIGGGDEINKYFIRLGFDIFDMEQGKKISHTSIQTLTVPHHFSPHEQNRSEVDETRNRTHPSDKSVGLSSATEPDFRLKRRKKLVDLLRNIPKHMRDKLETMKGNDSKQIERTDFIWHFLLQSFATMGNVRGWDGLIGNKANYQQVTFDALSSLTDIKRKERLRSVLLAARVRMPEKKSQYLYENFHLIKKMGGLDEVKKRALAQTGTKAKIGFIQQFHGIGDKYARNFWMDVYHPDFRNTVAVDERIKSITECMGYTFNRYAEHEQFYLDFLFTGAISSVSIT